ncbi:hypothetical protein DMI65_00050 [Escherichia coli]|nr:hypothetical protein [Escherichia coli]
MPRYRWKSKSVQIEVRKKRTFCETRSARG